MFYGIFDFIESKFCWFIAIAIAIYIYIKYYVYNYWKRHGIPHERPSIPFGNIPLSYFLGKMTLGNTIKDNYNKFKENPFHGFYALYKPAIIINNPELIRMVLVKNFSSFADRGWYMNKTFDSLTNNIFFQSRNEWKFYRSKISPAFTSSKMKTMYPLIAEICNGMIKVCDEELKGSNVINIKDLVERCTTDIITFVIYGFNCDTLMVPSRDFRHFGLKALEWGQTKMLFSIFIPKILQILHLSFYHKKVIQFFNNILKEIVHQRQEKPTLSKDFMNHLIQLINDNNSETEKKSSISDNSNLEDTNQFKLEDAAAQAFILFLAGFETSATVISYCLQEMAKNPDIQKRLHQEIDNVSKTSTGFTYDSIMQMEYLDMIINETLRKYTPVSFLNRICLEDFPIPGSNYTIPKGMQVFISPVGIHHNPKFFADPEKFDPSRYSKENPDCKSNFINLKFSEGPRSCIGNTLGMLQAKLIMTMVIYNYKIDTSDIISDIKVTNFLHSPVNMYLHFEKRKMS